MGEVQRVNELKTYERSDTDFQEYQGIFRWLLSILAFPLVIGAVITWAVVEMGSGQDPKKVLALGAIGGGLLVILLEFIHPHTKKWHKSHGDFGTDVLHLLLTTILSTAALEALLKLAFGFIAIGLAQMIGTDLWPVSLPLILQLCLALLIGDFGYYWWHRLAHENPFLWRFHATHHSVERLYWLNAARVHPIDNCVAFVLQTGPLLLLGAGPDLLALHALFVAVHGLFQHSNIRVKLGPLNWVFSMAELHRWHHSKQLPIGDHNYGANLIIWDVIFGTRCLPKNEHQDIQDFGIKDLNNFPSTYWKQLMTPFIWKKLNSDNSQSQ